MITEKEFRACVRLDNLVKEYTIRIGVLDEYVKTTDELQHLDIDEKVLCMLVRLKQSRHLYKKQLAAFIGPSGV